MNRTGRRTPWCTLSSQQPACPRTHGSRDAPSRILLPSAGVMASPVKLFLVRHGETVDNVAQLYAGSRDSALTNHGYQQAARLGKHLSRRGITFAHIFSSHLQRAVKTASLIREAQAASAGADDTRVIPDVKQSTLLTEQDFGYLEGKRWNDRSVASKNTPGFADVESKDAVAERANKFLDNHLLPLIREGPGPTDGHIVIVSHGIFLSRLWKCLLLRLPSKSVSLSSELQATARTSLEHLGGWSNTGYLELHITQPVTKAMYPIIATATGLASESAPSRPDLTTGDEGLNKVQQPQPATKDKDLMMEAGQTWTNDTVAAVVEDVEAPNPHQTANANVAVPRLLHGWTMVIMKVNAKDHLTGLKRTGGGVGSSRHDSSQKNIESFFKRRKLD